jgi:putative SOS response-associated peptidase YedK
MCGRFTLAIDGSELEAEFEGMQIPATYVARYNIAPSQPVLAITNSEPTVADFLVWGLIPAWAKDPTIGSRLINARGETLAEKPAFRSSYRYKRCVIPADGFYEWKAVLGTRTKVPHYVRLRSAKPFGLAGLWSEWRAADGSEVRTCSIITTAPNALMAPIHNRMPVILGREARAAWLDPSPRAPSELAHLLVPYPAEEMVAFPVSARVNSPANDGASCIQPA